MFFNISKQTNINNISRIIFVDYFKTTLVALTNKLDYFFSPDYLSVIIDKILLC